METAPIICKSKSSLWLPAGQHTLKDGVPPTAQRLRVFLVVPE